MVDHWCPGTHMCMLKSSGAVSKLILDFLTSAVRQGASAHYFRHCTAEDQLQSLLSSEIGSAEPFPYSLKLAQAKDVYLTDGELHIDNMLSKLTNAFNQSKSLRGGPVHIAGEMSWASNKPEHIREKLIKYERAVNNACKTHPFSAICQYRTDHFDGEFLAKIMAVHPYLVIDGMILPSPTYQADP